MSTKKVPKLSTAEVIKLFTNVPKKFVDDFLALYDPTYPADFVIDLDILANWLDVKKGFLLRTLRTSYKLNQDYITRKEPIVSKFGGNNYIKVMLTADCMKRLCLRSKSVKAETVRTYFIEIENFLFHYNDAIVDGLMKNIQEMQMKNISKKKPDGPGVVYVIKVNKKVKKFGHTEDMEKRLAAYNTGRINGVKLLHIYSTDYRKEVERCVKKLMEKKRYVKRKELYEVDEEIIEKLIEGCSGLSMKLHYTGSKAELQRDSLMNGKYYVIFSSDIPPHFKM